MKGEIEQFYDDRLRHLESPEFRQWFETWFASAADYPEGEPLRDEYFSERRFALIGWLAAKTQDAHKMTQVEFVANVLR